MKNTFLFLALSFLTLQLSAATNFERIIVFGDSLSDQGTYAAFAKRKGGGKYTTNPGKIWIEFVAAQMHLPIDVNRHEGFGFPTHILGGFNYAQGGARISTSIGVDSEKGYSGRPVTEQIRYFTSAHTNFKAKDIIFILAGANDIFAYLKDVGEKKITPEQAVGFTAQSAAELATIVRNLNALGAQNIVVLNLPMVEKTPRALGLDPQVQGLISVMVKTFNQTLQGQLAPNPLAHVIDFYAFDEKFTSSYKDYGIENVTSPACTVHLLANSSLFCSAKNLVKPGADLTYKFADSIHPATGFSKVAADFVWTELQKLNAPTR